MGSQFDVKHVKIKAIRDHVIVTDMDFGEQVTKSGIVIMSDDGKVHGIKPRWAKVYAVGPEQNDVKVGDWILIEHGRWTRKIKIDDGEGERDIQRVETSAILMVSDEKPSGIHIGQEYNDGEGVNIRPDDFIRA